MKKILFATDSFGKAATANGICTGIIANEFVRRGYEVHILCFQENDREAVQEKGFHIHPIKNDLVSRLANIAKKSDKALKKKYYRKLSILINRIEAMIFLPIFPMRAPASCYRYARKMRSLQKTIGFGMIVSSYRPFESVYALFKLECTSDVKKVMYTLDTLTDFEENHFMSKDFWIKKGFDWERKFYNNFDLILNPKCHEENYEQEKYEQFRSKLEIIDFPHIYDNQALNEETKISNSLSNKYTIIYAGALRGNVVRKMLDCLSDELEGKTIALEIYGYNSEDSLCGFSNVEARKSIKLRGSVPHEDILKIEKQADVLLSVGNTGSTMKFVPSKIFEYMSTGKKILHFCETWDDSCVEYYRKYPNACIINVSENADENKQKIREFLAKPQKSVSYSDLCGMFPMNTPEYTADIIENKLGIVQES